MNWGAFWFVIAAFVATLGLMGLVLVGLNRLLEADYPGMWLGCISALVILGCAVFIGVMA